MQALTEFLEDDGLHIPGVKSTKYPNGQTYLIPSPNIEDGLRIQAFAEFSGKIAAAERRKAETGDDTSPGITSAEVERLAGAEDGDFQTLVLGAAYAQMREDGVSWRTIQRLTQYAFAVFAFGEDQADKMVADQVAAGKAVAPTNRAARRGSKTTGTTRKSATASGGSSRSRKTPGASA